jgi:outer membrane protein assembly factor BamB
VIFSSGRGYHAVDAKTGKEAWRVKWTTQYGVNAADPVFDNGTMLISTGYGKGAALFKLGAGEPELVWQNKSLRSQMNPPVLIGGFLYGVDGDAGQKTALKCVEMSTGTEKWSVPLTGSGALAAADGKLIVLGGDGTLMIAPAAAADFKPTAQAKVLTGKCWTVPVLANGRLYCRNAEGHVVCVDLRKP